MNVFTKNKIYALITISFILSAPESLIAQETENAQQDSPSPESFYTKYIQNKLQLGTRMIYRTLLDSDSGHKGGTYGTGTYLGTIYALEEEQNILPTNLYMAYNFNKYLALECGYDSISAETVATYWYDPETDKTDGDVILSGLTMSLQVKIPNESSFTPYLGIGLAFYQGDFDEDPDWAYTESTSRERIMEVDDVTALQLTAGTNWAFSKNWFMDMSLQYTKADPDATFYGYTNGTLDTEQTGHFPMDNLAFRLGVGYTF